MKTIEPGTRYGKRVVFGAEPILRKTHKIRGLWMRCDCGREDLVDRYQVTRGLASQCLDCQKVEQSLRMEAKWAKRKGELMSKVLVDRKLLENLVSLWAAKGYGKAGSPGHCHEKPGIWDKGNGPLAGKPCAECAIYDAARTILAQPAEAEGVSGKHEISCWKCHEMTSLETRNEMDGCCWACGEEIDLDDYLINAMDKRDEHYAALSAVTSERDRLLAELERACANYNQVSYASTERGKQIDQLRAEAEALRKDTKL